MPLAKDVDTRQANQRRCNQNVGRFQGCWMRVVELLPLPNTDSLHIDSMFLGIAKGAK